MADYLLKEDGDKLLLETGDGILLQQTFVTLAESGAAIVAINVAAGVSVSDNLNAETLLGVLNTFTLTEDTAGAVTITGKTRKIVRRVPS